MPAEWTPRGVSDLEPAALDVVRSRTSTLVVAGPGSGKTELLAQRASYLLETGLCAGRRRILAISFKRDSAANLRDRVARRIGHELAGRIDSFTFDAFAKSLLDRFYLALDPAWRPRPNYEIAFDIEPRKLGQYLDDSATESGLSYRERSTLNVYTLHRGALLGRRLIDTPPAERRDLYDRAALGLWGYLLHRGQTSRLSFPMIGRMAALILDTNPLLRGALWATYDFVFLDEFQDTTGIQYALTRAAFLGSRATVTAVGDDKQRIMVWAGALDGVFREYARDFNAELVRLIRNYRAAPELVRVVGVLASQIDPNSPVPVAGPSLAARPPGECRVLLFRDEVAEANHLAGLIRHEIQGGVAAREICVLTRMKTDVYTKHLQGVLAANGVKARVESELQDLLAEPAVALLTAVLRLGAEQKSPDAWTAVVAYVLNSRGADSELLQRQVEASLTKSIRALRVDMTTGGVGVDSVVNGALEILDSNSLQAMFPAYQQGNYLLEVAGKVSKELGATIARGGTWREALDALDGIGVVPLMTIHKSKGLEYHTVIMVGFEDAAHFNWKNNADEETCAFFVACSRARQRMLFTFCQTRDAVRQTNATISRLYEMLRRANVPVDDLTGIR